MFNALRLLALSLLFLLSACSGGGTNSRIDYKEAKSLRTLATPPDLVVPVNNGTAELPEMGGEQAILPAVRGMRMERDGAERWLVSDTPAEELWPRLRGFWTTIGLELNLDLPQVGIMETNWAENRADAPGGFLTELVKSVFRNAYSAGTRDRYRLRLERRDNGGSEIFLTHYGLKEVVVPSRDGVSDNTRWEVRPSDPELVAEVNSRLLMHLGYSESSAKALQVESEKVDRAYLEGDGLVINEGFARSWRRTGIALDRLGVVVEDRDRSRGIYYVVEVDLLPEEKKGWLGSIFSSDEKRGEKKPQLQIELQGDEQRTQLSLFNMDGTPRRDGVASELLKRLHEELK